MNFSTLVRNAARVHQALQELPDSSVVALETVKIYVPARFLERSLAIVGVDNYILGIYGIVVEDKFYGTSIVNAMIPIAPSQTNRIKINGTDYLEFIFMRGDTVFKSTNLVKIDSIAYRIYDELPSGGRIPWYLSYDDVGKLFDTAVYHAGANIGANQEIMQIIASIIARDPDDRSKPLRSRLKTYQDVIEIAPTWISMKAISYTATNTTAKLAGNYQSEGVIAAIVHPAERTERIEAILRR